VDLPPDWGAATKTRLDGPVAISVAPYQYLCGGQLTSCVPQPATDRRLDAQGGKLMARVVYRRLGPADARPSPLCTPSTRLPAAAGSAGTS